MNKNTNTIALIDSNVDGCGTDVKVMLRIIGKELTTEHIDGMKHAVDDYKKENEDCWDSDGCFETAIDYLEKNGFTTEAIVPEQEIEI